MHGAAQGRQVMPNLTDEDTELEALLNQLSRARIKELRERWRSTFRAEPPPAFGPDLLRRSIAHRLQEQRYGGLSTSVQRQLNQLIKTLAKKRSGHIELPKRVKSGSVLVRLWKGKSYRVMVLDDGFAFDGRVYDSLSESVSLPFTGRLPYLDPAPLAIRHCGASVVTALDAVHPCPIPGVCEFRCSRTSIM
jgi:Protein of unknown function (DUF2924)